MTMQIPDSCMYDGRKWELCHIEGDTTCIPTNEQLGIKTVSPHTANWSGRIDHFYVLHEKLYLFKLEVNLHENSKEIMPEGARREIIIRDEPVIRFDEKGEYIYIKKHRTENLVFDKLHLPFTGTLSLRYPYGDDWEQPIDDDEIEEEEISIELKFEDGILIARTIGDTEYEFET